MYGVVGCVVGYGMMCVFGGMQCVWCGWMCSWVWYDVCIWWDAVCVVWLDGAMCVAGANACACVLKII